MNNRILVFIAGLCGTAGVVLSASASHGGGTFTGTAASFLLMHAPVLLAIGLLTANRILYAAGLILIVGLVLFCGDLLMRDFVGNRLFPFAAPTGGTLLIAGWLAIALAALRPAKTGD
ncbi:uncharacterized membrane protein YgdD (TMEM256/DUF423 family) [Aquamicrobium lusatiense]|jgi:uncharacterized membrane protein YgdD (TMEM256/DUF423 family)|uniref:Uncharacterized membrane protein YgdD (TMEM256/DUF423 family) n=1 Tax=Aquamicrobium lusatiense TaxID=89772 RepID=A0A7W9S575_9HYPH|nr:DUF423 domain-containing protein [Aquamicrobium lusatiense]MBB6013198.1 uncharacterized membrane protein YgdD (TMEM256/DUF423 family) [Aquamicrobium lusatiense]